MDTDAHLLFAALAVQLELIDSRQFAEAATIWAGDRARPLREILIERRWLTSDDCHLLDGLVQRKLAKHQGDARAALGETADLPVREALKDVPDDKIQQTMSVYDEVVPRARPRRSEGAESSGPGPSPRESTPSSGGG